MSTNLALATLVVLGVPYCIWVRPWVQRAGRHAGRSLGRWIMRRISDPQPERLSDPRSELSAAIAVDDAARITRACQELRGYEQVRERQAASDWRDQ
jgi:hypothetical protein